MSKLYLSILILLFPLVVFSQKKDTVKHSVDSLKTRFIPTGVKLGTDLLSIGKSQYVKSFTGWEVNAEVDFYRYFLAIDYGSWTRHYIVDLDNKYGTYDNPGNYYRVGIDANFLTKDPDKNVFFLGFRYAHSTFSEKFVLSEDDPFNNNVIIGPITYSNPNVKANWLELTSGLRVKMWKFIWLGYTARFKFAMKLSDTEELIPSDVPGYGRTDKEVFWGFNYQLFFRVPISKKK